MICPNLSDPNVKREFDKLTNIVGEDFAYYLWDKNNGLPLSQRLDRRAKLDKIISNKFYEQLEQDFNGDSVKTTLAIAVTYGNNFKKKYPSFDQKTPAQKVKIVKDYFANQTKSVEEISKSYITKSARASAIRRENLGGTIEITREQLEGDPNSVLNNLEPITNLDRLDAYVNFKKSDVSKHINYVNATNIVNSGAFATWTMKALNVYRGFDKTDLYHESWHEFSQKYLTPEERTELYNVIKSREGEVTLGANTENPIRIPYSYLTQKQAEEILAEEYRAFAITKTKTPEKLEAPVRNVFQKILDFFKSFFGNVSSKKTTFADLNNTPVFAMFETLYNGDLRAYSVDKANPTFTTLNRSIEFTLNYENSQGKKKYTFSSQEASEIFSFLDYTLYNKLRQDGLNIANLMDPTFRSEYVPNLYNFARNSVEVVIDELNKQIESTNSDSVKEVLENRIKYLRLLTFSDQNWDDLISFHQNNTEGEIFKVDLSKKDESDETNSNRSDEEQTKSLNTYDDRGAINPLQFYDPYVVELIRSLPDKRIVNGEVEINRGMILGLPINGNFLYNKNLLQNALSGAKSYQEVINRIQGLIEYNPQMEDLLALLPNPNKAILSEVELSLKGQFMQALTMPQITPYSVKAKSSEEEVGEEQTDENKPTPRSTRKKINISTFTVSTLTQDSIIEFLDNEFQLSASRNYRSENNDQLTRQFANTSRDGLEFATFSTSSVLDSYELLPNSSDQVIFSYLRDVFGVDLIQGKESSLFDKKGKLRQSVSPYTQGTVAATRKLALSSYNKIKLYDLIYNLPDNKKFKGLKNLIPVNIETPAKTFLNDLRADIFDRINAMKAPLKDDVEFAEVFEFLKNNFNKKEYLNNEKVLLFKAIENYYQVTKSGSFLNEAGDLEWSIREQQHLTNEISKINRVNNINELSGYLNPLTNNFVKHSALLKKVFNEAGEKRITRSRLPISLELKNITGFKGDTFGQKTINLSPEDKYVQDIGSFLKDGLVENLRNGAKSSSFGISVGESKSDRYFYELEGFSYNKETDTLQLNPAVIDQFRSYLEYELERIFDDSNGIQNKNAKQKRGSTFIIFNDILPKELKDQFIDNLANSSKSKEETVKALSQQVSYPYLTEIVTEFFNKELKTSAQELAEAINAGLIEANPKDRSSLSLEERFKDTFGDYDLYQTLAAYITNYYTMQVEYLHVLLADPSNFNIKSKDLTNNNWREVMKRLGSSISPGRQPILDEQDLVSYNSNVKLGRRLEALVSPKTVRNYDTNFTYTQFQDIKTFDNDIQSKIYRNSVIENYAEYLKSIDKKKKSQEYYLAQAEDILGESVDAVINQDKESDAQAYANLDFVRFYLNSVSEWTPKLETLYNNEVAIMEKILEYRKSRDPKIYNEIKRLQQKTDLGVLPSLKLGYWGSPLENTNYVTLGKYSVAPLLPSVLFETDLEDLSIDMLSKGIDFATFDSGSKMALPVESVPFYTKQNVVDNSGKTSEVLKVTPISGNNVLTFPLEGLRRQQYIAPKFKGEVTLSTQLVKLAFSNFYENGKLRSEISSVPGLAEKVEKAQRAFIRNIEVIVESEKAKIYSQIGATLDNNNNVKSFDTQKFANWIKSEFDKKDIPQSVYDYLDVEENSFVYSLDLSPQRALFENVLASALTKRVIKPKLFGEAFIQTASSGFNQTNTRFTKPTKAQIEKYGVSGLRDYGRIVNGKHQPADIKIAFNSKKYSGLLELEWKGEKIETLDRLNKALLDDEWVETHSNKLTLVGVRIPVQGFNSMEHLRIRQFLPESAGPVIIVPPSIVTKSGSDFDIDKLFMFEPEIDFEGNLKEASENVKTNPKLVYNFISSRNNLLDSLNKHFDLLNNKLEDFKAKYEDKKSVVNTMEKYIANNGMILNFDATKLTDQEQSDLLDKAFNQLTLLEKVTKAQEEDPEIGIIYRDLIRIKEGYKSLRDYTPGKIKSGFSNELISTISDILSDPQVMPQMIKPNDSSILKGIAERYDQQYRKGKGKISSSRMFTPSVSNQIFAENATGKKALGIDAKANALHKLFQQVGLRYTNSFFLRNFQLKANKSPEGISLGGYYDANNEYLISDIINEFINGHVDIEKEDWINYFNADKERTSILIQAVMNGVPINDAILLVNQPIVHHFIKNTKLNKTSQMLGFKSSNMGAYILDGLKALNVRNKYAHFSKSGIFSLEETINNILGDDYFLKHINNFSESNYKPEINTSRASYDKLLADVAEGNRKSELAAQLAFLTQYYLLSKQNQDLLKFTSIADFNTASYRNLNDFHLIGPAVAEAKENFNPEAIDKILTNSVVSPFNVTDVAISLGEKIFDILGTSWYQSFLSDFIKDYGEYWNSDTRATEVNNLNNAVIHALLQQYSFLGEDAVDFFLEYGPQSNYLTKNATNNLKAQFTELFYKEAQKHPELKQFVNSNLFIKNFKTKDVEATNKFYIAVETNERDPRTVDSIQRAFLDGLDFGTSGVLGTQDEELNEKVRMFFHNVANATIMGQGFSIKYRSIQPYLPLRSLEPLIPLIDEMDNLKKKFEVIEGQESEERIKFLEYIEKVKKHYVSTTVSNVKTLNKKKYFPNYRDDISATGIVISASKTGISAMLSPNTEQAKKAKKLTKSYPVTFQGKAYKDALDAYEKTKDPIQRESKLINKNLLIGHMSSILEERFRQHPRIFGILYDKGGLDLLQNSAFQGMPGDWSSNALNQGWYMQSLQQAYSAVLPELEKSWLESKTKQKPTEDDVTNIDFSVDESAFIEDAESFNYVGGEFEGESLEQATAESGLTLKSKPNQSIIRSEEVKPIINVYWGSPESNTNTRVLSNLAPRNFTYQGKEYGSVEHAYQTLKSGTFDQITYDKYVKAGGYGTKIRGKAVTKGFDNLQLMKDLVVESFRQNPNQASLLLNYSNFTHTTNEVIDKAFLEGLRLAQKEAQSFNRPTTSIEKSQSISDLDENLMYPVVDAQGDSIMLPYNQITAERLQDFYPNQPLEKLEKVAAFMRKEIENNNPDYDFESTCQ